MASAGILSKKENVVISAGPCSLTLLPQFGGKIASLLFHGRELLQRPVAPVAPRSPSMPFDASDASGWDECLPSVAGCVVQTPSGPAPVPDHGDLWRVPWTVVEQDVRSIVLAGSCFSLPLTLHRRVSLTETEPGASITLNYRLSNTGSESIPWSWAAHPLFNVEPDDRIVLPDSVRTLRLESSAANRLGRPGDEKQWPIAEQADGSHTDLSRVAAPDSGIGDKLFAGPVKAGEGWCALERPSAGLRITVRFDPDLTPYLGLWLCYGGWPERPGPKQVCVALEPATAPVDSLAITGPWTRKLEPGQSIHWPMHVDLESL